MTMIGHADPQPLNWRPAWSMPFDIGAHFTFLYSFSSFPTAS